MKEVYYWLVSAVLLAIGAVVYHFLLRKEIENAFLQTLVPLMIGAILARIGIGIEEGIRGAERKGRTPGA